MNEPHILTLNFDCLERILKLLDLESLCSVSETCKQLKSDAEFVFKNSKFAKSKDRLQEQLPSITDGPKWERTLRNFGHLMQSVYLIAELIEIVATILEKIQQKMPLMREVTIEPCVCHLDIKRILPFFPNVERLELISASFPTAQSEACELLVGLSGKLETLALFGKKRSPTSDFVDTLCNFKSLKTLQLFLDTKDMTLVLNNLAAKDVPIENLRLVSDLDDDLVDSICKFKIQKLRHFSTNDEHLFVQLVRKSPHLNELVVYFDNGSALDFLQKIIPSAENLTHFMFAESDGGFDIDTNDYEILVKIVQRRCSGIKLKIFVQCEFPLKVHPDSLRQHEKSVEIKKYQFVEGRWYW